MHRKLQFIISTAFVFVITQLNAQNGSISGIIRDGETAETLVGATVMVKELPGTGTSSDIDGTYLLNDIAPGTYTLQVSYVSFETKTISNVIVSAGAVAQVDISLSTELKSVFGDSMMVIVKGTPTQENINALQTFQKNAIGMADVTARDIFTRAPGNNSGDVLKRMPGTTMQDGKFAVIRGLSDRYNIAMVNGNVLPSTEPDRKTFSFDLFPSALLDNIIVYKTGQPNLPGDFAGGIIMLNTRDIPEENFFSVSAGAGYNTLTTFKEYYNYPGGKTEWLGLDDGSRDLPADFPADRDHFVDLSNAEKADLGKQFPAWGAESHPSSPLDQTYQIATGIVKPFSKTAAFGVIGALTYNNAYVTTLSERNDYDNGYDSLYAYNDNAYKNNVLWGALVNLSLKLNTNNKITLKNNYTVNSTDITTTRTGINYSRAVNVRNEYYFFNSNQLFSTLLGGDHLIDETKLKIHWTAGMNTMVRNQPDYRTVNYFKNIYPAYEGDTLYQMSPSPFAQPDNLGIFYSFLDEKTYTASLDLSYPFLIGTAKQNISVGGGIYSKFRTFDAREMGVAASNEIYMNPNFFSLVQSPVGELLSPENFSDSTFYIDELTNPSDSYTAEQFNKSVYAMMDNRIGKNVRVVWGVRAEFFNQLLHSFAYSFSSTPDTVEVNTAETDSVGLPFDLLPSINFTYALSEKTNLRFAGYKTVARQEMRELAPFGFYDIETNSSVQGNPYLIATDIYNADIKAEHFYGGGQAISGGVFFKKFYNPIGERVYIGSIRELKPINDSVATVYGAEFEMRKNLGFINHGIKALENFTFYTNLALIRSNTLLHVADTALSGVAERQMQGQSDYVLNFGLTYINPENGLSGSLLFNQIGRRIEEYGNALYEDIYENPRPVLDAQISVPFAGTKGAVKLNMSDLLSKNLIFYQDMDGDGKYVVEKDNTIRSIDNGVKYSLSISYKF